ncbi:MULTISPECIES: hypothetical protein [Arsenophonus]|uniref:hypothetical protein n=1 Tax=Arsenophonus TaxID=637 RepID=UPI0015D8B58C|nr:MULTISPECIES: hypothetical protein [Arsenophonus]UBX30244.1 hypothetical protein LDL57_06500 [Arsenophonus apicola]
MWGFRTWDGAGRINNSGVIPFLTAGIITVKKNQTNFSYHYDLPSGYKLDYTIIDGGGDIISNLETKNTFDIKINNNEVIGYPSSWGIPSSTEKQILVFYRRN